MIPGLREDGESRPLFFLLKQAGTRRNIGKEALSSLIPLGGNVVLLNANQCKLKNANQ
jgi:hypothetical protein